MVTISHLIIILSKKKVASAYYSFLERFNVIPCPQWTNLWWGGLEHSSCIWKVFLFFMQHAFH